MDRWLPGQTRTFGRAAIGHTRPDPLGGEHVMAHADDRPKAEKTGVYTVTNEFGTVTHQRFKEGAILPDGAEFRDAGTPITSPLQEEQARIAAETEERSKGKAPENRARGAAPANRGKG
jgi:hypothetical protein